MSQIKFQQISSNLNNDISKRETAKLKLLSFIFKLFEERIIGYWLKRYYL